MRDVRPVEWFTVGELRERAEAYLDERRGEHPESTVSTNRTKIRQFLDWLEDHDEGER
jgi:hypothetical protein